MISFAVRREISLLVLRNTKNEPFSNLLESRVITPNIFFTFQRLSGIFLETYPHIEVLHWLP